MLAMLCRRSFYADASHTYISFFSFSSWVAWYHPILRRGAPHPTNTTDKLLMVSSSLLMYLLWASNWCFLHHRSSCADFFYATNVKRETGERRDAVTSEEREELFQRWRWSHCHPHCLYCSQLMCCTRCIMYV